jgi:hypothetical protein
VVIGRSSKMSSAGLAGRPRNRPQALLMTTVRTTLKNFLRCLLDRSAKKIEKLKKGDKYNGQLKSVNKYYYLGRNSKLWSRMIES